MQTLLQDLKYGARMLARAPGFTAIAVLTLALGIGANTAIFSVVRAVLLRSLPFKNADRLVVLHEDVKDHGAESVAFANFQDWQQQNHVFSRMAAYSDAEFIVSGDTSSERIYGEEVTNGYFEMLGVPAEKGHVFLPEENQTPMKDMVAMIGEGLWQRRFGSDPGIVGKTITLNNARFTIIGVLPRGFLGLSDQAEVWIPVMARDAAWPASAKFDFLHNRGVHWLKGIATLKPEVSIAQAQTEMSTIAGRLAGEYPEGNRDRGAIVKFAKEEFTGSFRSPLYILLAAVGFVLLIGCANVANLVLSRTASREREMAIRLTLGAGRARLIRQFVTEGLLLSTAGAFLGFVIAEWGLNLLVAALPVTFPTFTRVQLDAGVLVFTCSLMVAAGILIGLLPALTAGRDDLTETLKEGAKGSAGLRGSRIGSMLVISEVALAVVLLAGAGLLLKSFDRLLNANPGFRPDHLLTMRFYVPDHDYKGDERNRFGPALAQQIATVPGVESAAVTFIDPFVWGGFSRGFTLENHPSPSTAAQDSTTYQEIGSDYFRTMGIPILSGRDFTMAEGLDKPRVLIISEAFDRKFYPGENPIGKRIKYGSADSKNPWMEIVGVVGNIKFKSLRQNPLLQSEALGIGASTAVFSIVNAVLLKPLPYPHAERIVFPWRQTPPGIDLGYNEIPWGARTFQDFQHDAKGFQDVGIFEAAGFNLTGTGDPVRIDGVRASAGFFRTMGIAPLLGRTFLDEEDHPGHDREVVLGYGLWQRKFAGDPGVFAFTLAVTLITGLLFGLAPALGATRENLVETLKEGAQRSGSGPARQKIRSALLVSEVALALVLVIAAGLLVRTFFHLLKVDPGFNTTRVLMFELTLPGARYPDKDTIAGVYRKVLNQLNDIPGVRAAGLGSPMPMSGGQESSAFAIPGRTFDKSSGRNPIASYTIASPGYFSAIGTPIFRGRPFLDSDTADSQPVAIISKTLADQFYPGEDPIGKSIKLPPAKYPTLTIVGIAADVKHFTVRESTGPEFYVVYTQKPYPDMLTMQVALRTQADPRAIIGSAREAIGSVDPTLPIAKVSTLASLVDDSMTQPRFSMLLLAAFAALALLLASIGIYGVISYAVAQRTQEFGIRLALGAQPRNVFSMVLGQGARLALLGVAVGFIAAFAVTRLMTSLLFGVQPTDPVTFIAVPILLMSVALLACYIPARRATRVDPIIALRYE